MRTVKVLLNSIDKVKSFVENISKFENRFELISGEYKVDAKSILGIFSLDLLNPICLHIYDGENTDQIIDRLSCYLV